MRARFGFHLATILICQVSLPAAMYAESPAEYMRNYDSLEYSTTAWSEPVNGLRVRVTCPKEIYFGEPLTLEIELSCALDYESSLRVKRYSLFDPRSVRLSLVGKSLTGKDSTLENVWLGTDSVQWRCSPVFRHTTRADGVVAVHFPGISGVYLDRPTIHGPLGQLVSAERVVARRFGLAPGMATLRLKLESWDRRRGYTPLAASEPFTLYAHPYVPLMRRLVIIAPRSFRLTGDCRLLLDEPETLSVSYDYYHFLHVISGGCGRFGISGADGDTVSLMGRPDSYNIWHFDDSLGSESLKHFDSAEIYLYSAPGPVEHMGIVSGKRTLLFKRVVPCDLSEEDRLKIIQCGELRVSFP